MSSAITTLQVAANPMFSREVEDIESASMPSTDSNSHKPSDSPQLGKLSPGSPAGVDLKRKLRTLLYVEYFLLFLCVGFAAVMIAATVQLLHITPFEPVFWLFIFSMIFYWLLSFSLIAVSMYMNKLRNAEEKVAICSKQSWMRNFKRVSFWIFVASLITSFACMMLLLRFVLPEAFFPSTQLRLQRLAGVTSDSAAIWIRDPNLAENAEVAVLYRLNGTNDAFTLSSARATLNYDNDFSAFIRIAGLAPATAYEWKMANSSLEETLSFRTHPAPGQPSQFSFYFGSCFLHNFPYLQEAPGFGYVLDVLKPDVFTFLGDFIYSDIPFFRNDAVETYHSLYRHALQNSHVQRLFQRIPNYHMWDDHEVKNNYPDTLGSNMNRARGSFEHAIGDSWQLYIGGGNPITQPGKTYFDFDYGDSSFFFADTRVQRSSNALPDGPNKTILGQVQKDYLKSWLLAKNSTSKFKFLLSPLGWTNDFPDAHDSWGGYKTERDEILDFIRVNRIEGVVLFSGDSHFAYAVEIGGAPGGIQGGFYEFSASPISAFDYTLGGFISETIPFKPEDKREDRVMFETIGRKGPMSLLGLVRVDTTKAMPEIVVEIYDSTTKIYDVKLELQQLRPWEAPQ